MMDDVANTIISAVGGPESAKTLFTGKIVGVERKLIKGHVYGEVIIDAADVSSSGKSDGGKPQFTGTLRIPFKNENIIAVHQAEDGTEETIATVPDLISVIDAQNGENIGTPEYRYGLLVIVIGITGSERWTSTPKGIEIGGPRAFGMDVEYKPLGVFVPPVSVIDEYDTTYLSRSQGTRQLLDG
jgi:DUF917 family protein